MTNKEIGAASLLIKLSDGRMTVYHNNGQILADGGGIEQAMCYQIFVLDLLALVQKLLDHYEERVPPEITAAVTRGRKFINSMMILCRYHFFFIFYRFSY